jgi:CubicO group peptidase (beta-lactamase class C family)
MFDHVSDPTQLGFDTQRLARLLPWMQRHVDAGRIPGAQVLVARHGRIALGEWTGRMDVEGDRPWAADTLVRIYSMTKPVTSVALLMLYEDGLVHLDDPVDQFVPEFRDVRVLVQGATRIDQAEKAKVRMTLHHLLTHTSGLTYSFNEGVLAREMLDRRLDFSVREGDLADTVKRLSELPLAFEPGQRWNYGVSTDVLGRVVEVVSGRTLDRFFAERILGPLGMADTSFALAPDRVDRMASCYLRTQGDRMSRADPGRGSAYLNVKQHSGGGGLISTAADYLRFTEMLRGRGTLGDVRLLAPKTVEVMTSNALPGDIASMGVPVFSEVPFDGIGFGLGVAVTLDPARAKTLGSRGDFAWGGMASTAFWVDPALGLSVVFLTQLIPSSSYPLRKELRALVYSSLVEP